MLSAPLCRPARSCAGAGWAIRALRLGWLAA
jgi:hypothetical protein